MSVIHAIKAEAMPTINTTYSPTKNKISNIDKEFH